MADNVNITPGSGNTVGADEVIDGTLGTVKVQYVKLMDGTLDGTTKAAVGANGLKVDGSGVTQPISGTVAISGTVPVSLATAPTTTVIQPTGTNLHVVVDSAPTTPVTGTFFQTTQPISAAALPLPSGASTAGNQTTGNSSLSSIDGKTPALGQALAAASVPVVLTAAQLTTLTPLSSISVSNFPATQPISATSLPLPTNAATSTIQTNGTQQTQLVQGGNTAVVDATGDLQVDVNNFPATQVISGTVTANAGSGTFAISAAALPLPSGAATSSNQSTAQTTLATIASNTTNAGTPTVSGTVTANAGTGNFTVIQPTGTNLHSVVDSGTITTITNPVTVVQATPASLQATVTQQTITKGAQGATGVTTQDLKDAGRNYVTFTADAVAGVVAETLLTFTVNKQGTATAAQTNYTVTSGKTLRIQSITIGVQAGAAAGEWVRLKLRHNTAGATTITSSLVITAACGTGSATTAGMGEESFPIPDGLEIYGNGTQTIALTHTSSATTNVESITLVGYEY